MGWHLEIGKMALYMAFPVGCFYYFNQPAYFEKWVIEKKREIFPPVNEEDRMEYERVKYQLAIAAEERLLKEYQESKKKQL